MLADIVIDNARYNTSYCHKKYQNGPFFHETTGEDEISKILSTELSLLPPVNDGCYLTIYYEGTVLEDKIYLLPRRRLLSQNNVWHLAPKSNHSYNYDQYVMETAGTKGTSSSKFFNRFLVSREGLYVLEEFSRLLIDNVFSRYERRGICVSVRNETNHTHVLFSSRV